MVRRLLLIAIGSSVLLSHAVLGQSQQQGQPQIQQQNAAPDATGLPSGEPILTPTEHPALPASIDEYWFVPDLKPRQPSAGSPAARLARGVAFIGTSEFADALPLLNGAGLDDTRLAAYAQYYRAVALIGLSRYAEANRILTTLVERKPQGYLSEAVQQRVADVAMATNDFQRAMSTLEDLADAKPLAREAVLLQMAQAAERSGKIDRALQTYRRIYYELPMTAQAADAQTAIARLETPDRIPSNRFKLELDRAQALFDARRWAQARAGFEPLLKTAQGDDRELVSLRLAECDYYLDRFRAARDRLAPYLDDAKREAEARFFHLTATRGLGDRTSYVRLARWLVDDFGESEWAAETLNNLATHHISVDEEAEADLVFREIVRRFPKSRHSERAAWKIGWRAYRAGEFREAATTFERAAAAFPRSDYRPSWLYWAARSRSQLDQPELAAARFRLVVADYEHSYYGRLALKQIAASPELQRVSVQSAAPSRSIPASARRDAAQVQTDGLLRELIAAQLYDDALREVQYAQRHWGDSARLQATAAFIRHNQGLGLKAEERFNAIRGAITTMRRAYPQFMADGGDTIPPDVLRIIFPLDYWPLITKYSSAHSLDPYLIAALMAQESTFTPEIRSSANAIGLLQITPPTGRTLARQLGIRRFTASMLTQAETNVRMGTKYFKDMVDKFGGVHYALAGYNAGESRVIRWKSERPGLDEDEFIDDIPFPETQNYVKRILGTAEDYRRLYGEAGAKPHPVVKASGPAKSTPAAKKSTPARKKPAPAKKKRHTR